MLTPTAALLSLLQRLLYNLLVGWLRRDRLTALGYVGG